MNEAKFRKAARELGNKYTYLRNRLAGGLGCNYTLEDLKRSEAIEFEALKAKRTPVVNGAVAEKPLPLPLPTQQVLSLPQITSRQVCELKPFQESAYERLAKHILFTDHSMTVLMSGVGTGKTFQVGALIDRLDSAGWKRKFAREFAYLPPYWWITKAQVVTKTKRDLSAAFGLTPDKLLVTAYEQLRSSFGAHIFSHKTLMIQGEPETVYEAKEHQMPYLIIWDECHSLKNDGSRQSKLAQSINELPTDKRPYQIFMSATVGTKLADFKCICCATNL